MRPLETRTNEFMKLFGDSLDFSNIPDVFNAEGIAKEIGEEDNPLKLRWMYFDLVQLFHDFLMDKAQIDDEQEKIWNDLCLAGKAITGSFYRGEGVNHDAVEEFIEPNLERMLKMMGTRGGDEAKSRHCAYMVDKLIRFGNGLPRYIGEIGMPDTLVSVASGAFEPTFLAMDILEMDYMLPIRYSKHSRLDRIPLILENGDVSYPGNHLHKKKVLVIEDMVDSGESVEAVLNFVKSFGPERMRACAVKRNTGEKRLDYVRVF